MPSSKFRIFIGKYYYRCLGVFHRSGDYYHKRINFQGKTIDFAGATYSETVGAIAETFSEEQYRWLNVSGRDVVDIGANKGDSAIYFPLRGSKRVIAFEPYPTPIALARLNISNNGIHNVKLIRMAVTGHPKIVYLRDLKETGGANLKNPGDVKTLTVTLNQIVSDYKIHDGILKMDCEGSEYGIVRESTIKTLRAFRQIMIEYHTGIKNLIGNLEHAGFDIVDTIKHRQYGEGNGYILAVRHDL